VQLIDFTNFNARGRRFKQMGWIRPEPAAVGVDDPSDRGLSNFSPPYDAKTGYFTR